MVLSSVTISVAATTAATSTSTTITSTIIITTLVLVYLHRFAAAHPDAYNVRCEACVVHQAQQHGMAAR